MKSVYKPLVHKYRPSKFAEVIGQRRAVGILMGMLSDDQVPPTVMICGPHATGKTTLARILARRINCVKPNGEDPCGTCASCKPLNHPDIVELNAADKRGIDDIRGLIDVSRLAPTFKKRVFILDECHMLTPQAFQASLKLFEEPSSASCFVMVTTDPDKVPDTILSRCSKVRLSPVSTKLLADWLVSIAKKESFKLSTDQATRIADSSGGHPREALHTLEQVIAYSKSNKEGLEIEKIVGRVVQDSPKGVVIVFLKALVDRDLALAFKLVRTAESPEAFLTACVDSLRGLVRYTISDTMVDGYHKAQFRKFGKIKIDGATFLLKVWAEALHQAKTYVMPTEVIIDLAIARSARA